MELYKLSGLKSGGVCLKCRHNTDGRNCHYCKEGFYRDPKKPLTHRKTCTGIYTDLLFFYVVVGCQVRFHVINWLVCFLSCLAACKCNLHAKSCQFNKELYLLSGRNSGGVCLKCRHNTKGRHCHYCQEGFYRDKLKPITHRKACKGRRHSHPHTLWLPSPSTITPIQRASECAIMSHASQ